MFFPAVATVAILLLADITTVNAASGHALSRLPRHHDLSERLARSAPPTIKKTRKRRSCKPRPQSPSSSVSDSVTTPEPTTTKVTPTTTKATTSSSPKPSSNNGGNVVGNILGVAFKPSDWPTATQPGAAPAATRTSPADPYLMELSKSYNNKDNDYYTTKHTGQMTYYGQGLGACGDTYDDSSFTAAVSMIMYDAWPGATAETNRNPICGPYVMGRKTISSSGSFITSVSSPDGFVNVGGDGFLNCDTTAQCHVPLTATVTHGGKSIIVQVVDRCVGCAENDIDLTPTAFAALADMGLGRTDVVWWFNQY